MNYGPHNVLVEEIIATIAQNGVLRPKAPVDNPDAIVVSDLQQAKEYAWERPIDHDESPTWTDLREDETAPLHAVPYERPELKPAYDAVSTQLESFMNMLRGKLSAAELIDDIGADLLHCAMNRALHGVVENSFWERLWRVYRQGAWPCGWEGNYPAGRMIIYQPPIVST